MHGNSAAGGSDHRREKGGLCYPRFCRVGLLGLALLQVSAGAGAGDAGTWTVTLAELERPGRGGARLLDSGLRPLMAAMAEEGARRLVLHHPGGDRGTLRAQWLTGQLVALGLPRDRIGLAPGGVAADRLRVEIREGVRGDPVER